MSAITVLPPQARLAIDDAISAPPCISPFNEGETRRVFGEPPTDRQLDQAVLLFVSARSRLFRIAWRILRSPFEAEDIVQETWIRWQGAERAVVINADAFLTTTTTRLALNRAHCAPQRSEIPADPWLRQQPEPTDGPEPCAERSEAVELAVLLLLAKLTPHQRAVYLLREAFDYRYEWIAALLEISTQNCRQLVRRAKHCLISERRCPVSSAAHQRMLRAFLAAAQDGQIADLEHLLVADVAAPACPRPRRNGSHVRVHHVLR